jgi:hypothetical protein
MHPRQTSRARFGVPRPPTASTRSAPGGPTCSNAQTQAENWLDWYAAYMVAEQTGADLPS